MRRALLLPLALAACVAPAADPGAIRRQQQQPADRIAGSVHRARLDDLGDSEQRRDHRGLGPLLDS